MEEHSLAEAWGRKTTVCVVGGEAALSGSSLAFGDKGASVPLASIRRVLLVGRVNMESALLYALLKKGVSIDWLDRMGRSVGSLEAENQGPLFLLAQTAFCAGNTLPLTRELILAKVDNCQETLRRRKPGFSMDAQAKGIREAASLESLLGHEGAAARHYFGAWEGLTGRFAWHGRKGHPPADGMNAMLSLGYTLLANRLASALHWAGLNTRLGFFHHGRGTHRALASDLMEPLRPLVDSTVLRLAARHEMLPEEFKLRGEACLCANGAVFVKLLGEFEKMFNQEHMFYSEGEGEKRTLNDILDDMAESFALHCHDGAGFLLPRLYPCRAGS